MPGIESLTPEQIAALANDQGGVVAPGATPPPPTTQENIASALQLGQGGPQAISPTAQQTIQTVDGPKTVGGAMPSAPLAWQARQPGGPTQVSLAPSPFLGAQPPPPGPRIAPLMLLGSPGGGLTPMGKLLKTELPEQASATQESFDAQQRMAENEGTDAALRQQELAQHEKNMGSVYDQQRQVIADRTAARDQIATQLEQDAKATSADVVNPQHYMSSRSGWDRLTGGLGLMFGGGGAAMAHQENLAAKMLQDNVKQDIDAQVANIGQRSKGREMHRGALQMNLERFGDKDAALAITAAQMKDQVASHFGQIAQSAQTGKVRETANMIATQARIQASQGRIQAADMMARNTQGGTAPQINPAAIGQLQSAGYTPEMQAQAVANGKLMGMTPAQSLAAMASAPPSQTKGEAELDIKRAESGAKGGEQAQTQASHASDAMREAKIPERDAALKRLEAIASQGGDNGEAPGFGIWEGGALGSNPGGRLVGKAVLSERAKANQHEFDAALMENTKALHVRAEPEQQQRIKDDLAGSLHTTARLRDYTARQRAILDAEKENILKGATPEAAREFAARKPAVSAPRIKSKAVE